MTALLHPLRRSGVAANDAILTEVSGAYLVRLHDFFAMRFHVVRMHYRKCFVTRDERRTRRQAKHIVRVVRERELAVSRFELPRQHSGGRERHAQSRLTLTQGLVRLLSHLCHLQMRRHSGEQLTRTERFHEIVVGSSLHALDSALFPGARGQHDHWHAARAGISAERPQQAEPIESRHHHVGQHKIRHAHERRGQCRLTIRYRFNAEHFGEQAHDVLSHVGVVVGHQNARPIVPGRCLSQIGHRHHVRVSRQWRVCCFDSVGQPSHGFLDVRHRARACGILLPALRQLFGGQMIRAQRQCGDEGRACTEGALGNDRPTVQPDEFLHE